MSFGGDFPVIGGSALNNVFGVVDPYVVGSGGSDGNGAKNALGTLYTAPPPAQSQGGTTVLTTAAGYGCWTTYRYVRYVSTANPAMVAGPAPVYYTDETFTIVSGVFSEGIVAATGSANSIAGFLLPNTGSVAGVGLGSGVSATLLNNNYVWIAVEGFVPSCYLAAGAQSNSIMGASGNFTTAVTTGVNRPAGIVVGAVTSNIGDVLVTVGLY
jgi:hypothetical protein